MKKNNFKKGLTLIELVIYIGIVGIVLVALTSLATNLVYSQGKYVKSNEIGQNLNLAYQRLAGSIENATGTTGSLPANQLTLNTSSGTITYQVTGNVLEVSENGGPAVPLTNSKVVVSPPSGGQIFSKVINGDAEVIKVELDFFLATDITSKETLSSSILMRGQ